MNLEARLKELGLSLPVPPQPVAAYVPGIISGNLVFVSGQLPTQNGELLYAGKVGQELTIEEGQAAARYCLLNGLAVVKSLIGSLDEVNQVVRLNGYVQTAAGFNQIPQVINGASELLLELFGEKGRHSRVAVGVASLPLGAAVEIDFIIAKK
ncbi:MAG: RidA family protein [Methylocystaceae bacterium]